MQIRQASLDDTQAISQLFVGKVERWQRMNAAGQVEDLPYEQLNIYERWLHGGAWLSIETGAVWLSHLLGGAGVPIVLLEDHAIRGYAEYFISQEPAPFHRHLHIRRLVADLDADQAIYDHLVTYLLEQAQKIGRITVASTSYDHDTLRFYEGYGFSPIHEIQQYTVPTQSGNVGFYKVSAHPTGSSSQIQGWLMPIGRTESARFHWEELWPALWHGVPKIIERTLHRQHINAAGQEAYVCSQQQLYDPRNAEIYCWTPKPMSAQLMSAIRDWAHKVGYRTLTLTISEKLVPLLGSQAEKRPYQQTILAYNGSHQ